MVSQMKLARCRRQYHYGHVPCELEIEIAGSRGDHYCMGVRVECDKNLNVSVLSNVHWAAPNKVAMDFSGRPLGDRYILSCPPESGRRLLPSALPWCATRAMTLDTPAYMCQRMCDNWLLHCDAGCLAARLCKVSSLDSNRKPRELTFSFLHLEQRMRCVMLLLRDCPFLTIIH